MTLPLRYLFVKCICYWYSNFGTARKYRISNAINGIKLIVYRYKSDSIGREKDFDIITGNDMIPSQTRKIFYNYTVNFACKNVLGHFLKQWTAKPLTTKTIINIIT